MAVEIGLKWKVSRNFFLLFLQALKTHKLKLPAMMRNFFMFFLTSKLIGALPLYRGRLKLGKNVRIQKFRTIQLFGKNAHIELGENSIVYENALLEAVEKGSIRIGDCGILGDCRISSRESVTIGKRVLVSWNVFIQDYDSHPIVPEVRAEQVKRICRRFYPQFTSSNQIEDELILSQWAPPSEPRFIGDDVWLGAGVIVLKGAQIGHGSTVASGSVVTSGVYPPRSVLAGNPARVVKSIADFGEKS